MTTKVGISNLRKNKKLSEKEKNNDNLKEKKLNDLLEKPFKFYLEKILNDKELLIDEINVKIKTLKDMFVSETSGEMNNKTYTNEDKQRFKNNIIKIMNKKD